MIEAGDWTKRSIAKVFSFALLCDPGNPALRERIEGQLRDLGLEVEWENDLPGGDELHRAEALAREHHATAVVWFRNEGGELVVSIAAPASKRILVRGLGKPSSATLETAALLVRGALEELAAGGVIGIAVEEPKPAPPPPEPLHVARPASHDETRFSALVAWRVTLDGAPIHQGPSLRVAWGWRRLELGIGGAFGIPTTDNDRFAAFTLARYAAGAFAGLHLVEPSRWSVLVGIEGGAAGFHRSTQPLAAALTPSSPSTTLSPVFAALLEARFRLTRGVRFTTSGGVDVVPLAPDVGYTSDVFRSVVRVWPVQPRAEMGLSISTD